MVGEFSLSPVERHGELSIREGLLVDHRGKPVVLRGMSLFWSQWGAKFYTYHWMSLLAHDWKVDVVRAAMAVEPDGYLLCPERELAKIYSVIDAAISLGIYVIVDWHAHRPHTESAMAFFDVISQRYGRCANLLFEPWNEPSGSFSWADSIKPHHESVIRQLRSQGNENVVICGTPSHCRDVEVASEDPISLSNVCYSLHFYAGSHREGLRMKVERASAKGICIFASEFGLSEAHGSGVLDLAEADRWWKFLEKHRISHLNWSFFDKDETSSALRTNSYGLGLISRTKLSASGAVVRARLRAAASNRDMA